MVTLTMTSAEAAAVLTALYNWDGWDASEGDTVDDEVTDLVAGVAAGPAARLPLPPGGRGEGKALLPAGMSTAGV